MLHRTCNFCPKTGSKLSIYREKRLRNARDAMQRNAKLKKKKPEKEEELPRQSQSLSKHQAAVRTPIEMPKMPKMQMQMNARKKCKPVAPSANAHESVHLHLPPLPHPLHSRSEKRTSTPLKPPPTPPANSPRSSPRLPSAPPKRPSRGSPRPPCRTGRTRWRLPSSRRRP